MKDFEIGVQLVDVQTEEYLWVQKYDRNLQDIFAIQSEIAQHVAEALTIQLRTGEKGNIERRPTENTEAHRLYLKGRYYWNERTREGMDKAAKYFEQALKLDPRFALAYAALADCSVVSPSYGWGKPREEFPKAREYALKAIEIDSSLAEPHASLAMVYADYEYRWHDAEEEFKQAVLLKASYATAYHWYSIVLAFMGRYSDSYEQAKLANSLDPLSQIISVNLGVALLGLGRIKEAIKQFERIREEDPNYVTAHNYLGWAYYLDSRTDEAIGEQRKAVDLSVGDPQYQAELACVLGFAGRIDEAKGIIKKLNELSKSTYISKFRMAFALFGIGSTDEAFAYLEKAYEERSSNIMYFKVWPWFKEARQDTRWALLEKRLGLTESSV